MAPILERPLSVNEVLEQELAALAGPGAAGPDVQAALHRQSLRALCLSGGGIRSASFALGVTQGMARKGLLDQFDYLSTVSGGGYIGGWLSSWIARASLPTVIEQLRRRPADPLDPEPAPIRHLRSYSNYLTPRLGALSADTWTLGATYLRNLFLNWLALLPPLMALLSLPLVITLIVSWQPVGDGVLVQYGIGLALAAIAVIGSVAAVRYVHVNRPRQRGPTEGTGTYDEMKSQGDFLRECLGPLLVAAMAVTICWAWATSYASPIGDLFQSAPRWLILGSAGAAVHLVGWLLARASIARRRVGHRLVWWHGLSAIVTGFLLGACASGLATLAPPLWDLTPSERAVYSWLAVPVLLIVLLIASHLYVGYTSTKQTDAEREWSARFTAWVLIVISGWLVVFGLVTFGPAIVRWVVAGSWLPRLTAVAGAASGVIAAVIGRRTSAPAGPGMRNVVVTRLAFVLAGAFLAWLVIALSWSGGLLMRAAPTLLALGDTGSTGELLVSIGVVVVLFFFGVISARFIDTNMFSLHAMYRSRLIRAYLGASRPEGARRPNPFTGFDDNDNLHLRELWPQPAAPGGNQRPLHIINAALNVVSGERLAWQERKADSFTFSPLHCGCGNLGYRRTQEDHDDPQSGGYAGVFGASLGTAMAISGAAASPEMGYRSSPVLEFLMTLFNIRLGWWLGNPGEAGRDVFHRSSPKSSLRPIVDEALGRATDSTEYVYLSDGGHFENLGIYEMVRRRCHVIVAIDATGDGAGESDLGNAVRKIRIDMGIPIDIPEPAAGSACAVGAIRYSCVDVDAPDGVLIHVAAAAGGALPADVRAYAQANPAFPRENTGDQWFTESQFESYRQLGSQIIEAIAKVDPPLEGATMEWFVRQAKEHVAS